MNQRFISDEAASVVTAQSVDKKSQRSSQSKARDTDSTAVLKPHPHDAKSKDTTEEAAADDDDDDQSSGYDTLSECASQGTIHIICNLNPEPLPRKHYHGNKSFLSRRTESKKYIEAELTVEQRQVVKQRPLTSGCLNNLVWHTDIKPVKQKDTNQHKPRLQSPWKSDVVNAPSPEPCSRPLRHSRAQSAPETQLHTLKTQQHERLPSRQNNRLTKDNRLPDISVAQSGNKCGTLKCSQATLFTPNICPVTQPKIRPMTQPCASVSSESVFRPQRCQTSYRKHIRSQSSFQTLHSSSSRLVEHLRFINKSCISNYYTYHHYTYSSCMYLL